MSTELAVEDDKAPFATTMRQHENPSLLICPPSIHIHGHAPAGSDECSHERDERVVRKYNKEVVVNCNRKLSAEKRFVRFRGHPSPLLGLGRVKSPRTRPEACFRSS